MLGPTEPAHLRLALLLIMPFMFCNSAVAQDTYGPAPVPWGEAVVTDYDAGLSFASQAATTSLSDMAPQCNCPSCTAAMPNTPSVGCKTCCKGCLIDWSKYPETIRPFPRPGIFPIPPQGSAYYSMWDCLTGQCRPAPPKSGYSPFAINGWPFFDADWRYVDGIPDAERTLVESLKRIHLNDCWLLSTGGEYWVRYTHEHNSRLTEAENDYDLHHVRLYGDLWYSDWLRIYGEYIWADSFGESLPPLPPEVDRGDILNLFVDLNLFDFHGRPVYVRGGRQELLYGSQRLVSPVGWANRRFTFQGVKFFRQGEMWDFDAFWMQLVPPDPDDFNSSDENVNLAGTWLTCRPAKGETFDVFYLLLDNENSVVQQGIVRAPFQSHTIGSRWAGDRNGCLWDFERALQFGEQNDNDLLAGMFTAGLGRNWQNVCLTPTAWVYYDYASGDSNPTAGDVDTFNQLFPFGHYYLGWMDLVGRQNIHDVNAHLYLYPGAWVTVWLQYHHFWLAERRDALYNAAGVAYRRDPTGAAGNNVGDEVDLVLNFHLTRYSDILVSYNKLFGAGFLEATAGPNQAADAETLYLMFQQRW